jgi:hypothetical protein
VGVIRDFNSHDEWHDVVDTSRIEGGQRSDQVGCVRSFTLKDGNRIREQLLSLSSASTRAATASSKRPCRCSVMWQR